MLGFFAAKGGLDAAGDSLGAADGLACEGAAPEGLKSGGAAVAELAGCGGDAGRLSSDSVFVSAGCFLSEGALLGLKRRLSAGS